MTALLAQGLDFEDMFDLAPVSLWMEDYSQLKRLFDQWRAQGVTDLRAFLHADPARKQQCCDAYQVLRVNRYTLDLFKAADQDTLRSRLHEVLRDCMLDKIEFELLALWEGQQRFHNVSVNYDLEGRKLNVEIQGRILPGYEDSWERVLVALKDITSEVQKTEQLERSQQFARAIFEQSPASLWVQDFSAIKHMLDALRASGIRDLEPYLEQHPEFAVHCAHAIRIVDVNPTTLQLFGAHSLPDLQRHLPHLMSPDGGLSFQQQLLALWQGQLRQRHEVMNYTLGGEILHLHLEFAVMAGHTETWGLVLLSLLNITERKQTEASLQYLSQHDVLTHLHNRAFYMQSLEQLKRQGPWPIAVIAMDMNGLKVINDTQGHAQGDAMLRRVGEILATAVTHAHCIARTGGDEFMVLLANTNTQQALAVQQQILASLELNNQFYPGETIHLAMGHACCEHDESLEAAVHRADKAMYAEKRRFYASQQQDRRTPAPV